MTIRDRFGYRSVALAVATLASIAAAHTLAEAAPDDVAISRDSLAAFEHYQALEQPQFFALAADGMRHGYSYCPEGLCPRRTPAKQLALEACEQAGGRGCRIIAAGQRLMGKFSVFGELTKDPLAEEMFRVTRDLVPKDQISDDELRSIMSAKLYSLHGALAYSAKLDRWGVVGKVDNAPTAREAALQRCGAPDCAVIMDMGPDTGCVGYGIDSGGPTFATGKTDFSARKAAERKCAAMAKGCSRIETACRGRAAGK